MRHWICQARDKSLRQRSRQWGASFFEDLLAEKPACSNRSGRSLAELTALGGCDG